MTSSVVVLRRSSKALLPKATLSPKKCHGHCLVGCCPSDPLRISESWWNHYIWEVCPASWWDALDCSACSRHWGTEWAQFFTTPGCTVHNQHFRSWTNWTTKVCLIHHMCLTSRQPTTASSSTLMTFCRENTPTRGRKCFPRVHWIPKHGFFTL